MWVFGAEDQASAVPSGVWEFGRGEKEAVRCPGHNGMSHSAAQPGTFRHTWKGDHVSGAGDHGQNVGGSGLHGLMLREQ